MSPGNNPAPDEFPDPEKTATDQSSSCTAMASILNRIGDKWSVMVFVSLRDKPVRFNQLRRQINGISQRMLTRTLRNLERDGLITRTLYPEIPPKVEYELTPVGRTLLPVIGDLWDWAAEHQSDVAAARETYDALLAAAE